MTKDIFDGFSADGIAQDESRAITAKESGSEPTADSAIKDLENTADGRAEGGSADDGISLSPTQRLAVETRNKTLLVSAAAGSGKTFTLSQRILASITQKDKKTGDGPLSIDSMLIVTFTRSSAADLRRKIGKTIREEIEKLQKMPERDEGLLAHLEKQLHALPSARICTIDSFCQDILRANADRVGISTSFRIPDAAECAIIGESILNGIIGDIYAGKLPEVASPEALSSLSECLTNTGKDSDLAAIISKIHLSTVSTVKGVESFTPLVEEYNPKKFTSVENTHFGSFIMERLHGMAEHFYKAFSDAATEIEIYDENKELGDLVKFMRADAGFAGRLMEISTYSEAHDYLPSIPFYDKAVKNSNPALPPSTQLNSSFKAEVTKYYKDFFSHSEAEWRHTYEGLFREFGTLLSVLRRYDMELRREKTRRNICEFHDIERYTYECMWQDGKCTDIAEAQRRLFTQIYIDEYQDVNELQDKIFEAISTPTNRFMVGDIKQSIYRFRGANPDIFAKMKITYPDISEAADSDRAAIFMSENYRCDRGVIDFTNLVFDRIFEFIGRSIGYVKQDRLTCSKYARDPEGEPPSHYPEICLIDSSELASKRKDDPTWSENMLAPYVTAAKIRELIAEGRLNEPKKDPVTGKEDYSVHPGDIAIIMRTAKGRINDYKRALDEYGIRNAVAEDTKFFLTPEALLALCLLNSIDNPRRDVYLAGLMLSPLYSFTESELVLIRKNGEPTLYQSLLKFIEDNPSYTKGVRFVNSLKKYRTLSEGTPTDELIMRLYHETGLLALAAKNGTKDRLFRLYEYARSYESGSFKGLYNFISYINNIIERKNSLDKREPVNDPEAVKIITAHSSKGLEYPIVFYVGGEDSLNKAGDSMSRFDYSEGFGIGMYLRSKTGLALVKNSTRKIISAHSKHREIEEEARILYVTLTRARERLYVVAPAGKKMKDFEKDVSFSQRYLDEYEVYHIGSLFKMLLVGSGITPLSPDEFLKELPPELMSEPPVDTKQTNVYNRDGNGSPNNEVKLDTGATLYPSELFEAPTDTRAGEIAVPTTDSRLTVELEGRFKYEYDRINLTRLPSKVSASSLFPRLLDGAGEGVTSIATEDDRLTEDGQILTYAQADDGSSDHDRERVERLLRSATLGITPSFISGEDRHTAADRGIATHLLFQFCNLERLKKEGAVAELAHLVEEKYLSETDAKLVRTDEVERFRSSRLIDEMIDAKELYREFRFNVKLPAEVFATERSRESYRGVTVLVQGVIDCLYLGKDGEYHLIDYKTDRLTKEERRDREAARRELCNRHSAQLYYYGMAIERIFGKKPVSREVYALHLGDTLSVVTEEYP